ncbi:YciI family protein [Paraherbaspirillum soli]|uniref:YciI family protein n=1 Tax=Paraherbaspirillum soli TaxID=631222 RepID=A0ABW0M4P4_9BURK
MYLVMLHYIQPLEIVDRWRDAHRAFLDRHYASGDFLLSGPKVPRTGGVIMVKDVGAERLKQIFEQDPFQQQRIAEYEIVEFSPVKHRPEFRDLV